MPFRHAFPLAVATATVVMLSVGAHAADLPNYGALPTSVFEGDAGLAIATDRWTGFYAGIHGGARTTNEFEEDRSGWQLGGQVGYLQQFDMFVVGAEVAATWADELNYVLTPDAGLKNSWTVDVKGRAGVALGSTLLYGTAGATFAELSPSGTTTSGAETHLGAVFGGGVEQDLGNNISLRAEYLQTRFFDVDSAVAGVGRTDDLTNHSVTVGVNYRF